MEEGEVQKAGRIHSKSIALFLLIVIILGALVLLQLKDSTFRAPEQARFQKGRAAPDFALPRLDGKIVRLSDYRGKVVLLNIWATWCPPCVEEMPSMERLYEELKGEDFEILAVSIDALGAKAVGPFMKRHHLSFPALLNPSASIRSLYGTTGIPESFIIDKQGTLVETVIGPRDWATPEAIRFLRNLIQKP